MGSGGKAACILQPDTAVDLWAEFLLESREVTRLVDCSVFYA